MPMLCTVGKFALTEKDFPPDGVCDLVFYTHVFYSKTDNSFHGMFEDAFQVFKTVSARYIFSQFGMSLSERYASVANSVLGTGPGNAEFKRLLDAKIVHHGLLSVTGDPATVLPVLQKLKDLQLQNNPAQAENEKNFIVLGLRGEYGKPASFGKWMETAKNSPYDIIVLHTHVSRWRLPIVKGISGASIWDSKNHQYCSMKHVISELNAKNLPASQKKPVFMLSLTMAVHMFTLPAKWKADKKSIKEEDALNFGKGDYAEACVSGQASKEQPEHFMVKSVQDDFQVIYDTSDTMIEKMKLVKAELAKKSGLPSQGWAVFDAELDDSDKVCPSAKSGFERLLAVRSYLDTAGGAP